MSLGATFLLRYAQSINISLLSHLHFFFIDRRCYFHQFTLAFLLLHLLPRPRTNICRKLVFTLWQCSHGHHILCMRCLYRASILCMIDSIEQIARVMIDPLIVWLGHLDQEERDVVAEYLLFHLWGVIIQELNLIYLFQIAVEYQILLQCLSLFLEPAQFFWGWLLNNGVLRGSIHDARLIMVVQVVDWSIIVDYWNLLV